MVNQKRFLHSELVTINLFKEHSNNCMILDVGGGGEGIIGQIYGNKVVAIDRLKEELLETENDSLKIVMNAEQMNFLDNSFDVVTIFYSLMFMDEKTKKNVLKECQRVLKPKGILEIWDTHIPSQSDERDIFLMNLKINLPEKTITTSYGVPMNNHEQSFELIKNLLDTENFKFKNSQNNSNNFYLRFSKEAM